MSDGTTHAEGCYGWGPKHYACALAEVERLKHCRDELREATIAMNDPAVNNLTTLPEAIRNLAAENERLKARLAEAMMYLRECRSLLTGDEGGFIPAGMGEFLRAADSAALKEDE